MVTRPIFPALVLFLLALVPAALVVVTVMRTGWVAKRKLGAAGRVVAIALILFGMGMRPMVPNGKARSDALNVDCLFVVDTTLSMWANDYGYAVSKGTRIDGAKKICTHMVDELTGSSFAIVTFNNKARVLAPFTQDVRTIEDAIDVMNPPSSQYSAQGTSMSAPIEKMGQLLESAAKRSDRKTIVVLISDGETTDDSEMASYAALADYVDGGLVIGVGTEQGATMTIGSGWSKSTIKDPETYDDAISKLDEKSLRSIASDLGIGYVHAEKPGDVDDMILRLRDEAQETLSEREELTLYDDIYWIGAYPLAGILAYELYLVIVKRRI